MTENKPIWRSRVTAEIVLRSIAWYQAANARPPSLADMAALMGIGKTATLYHVKRLESAGKVTRQAGKQRTIRVVGDAIRQ